MYIPLNINYHVYNCNSELFKCDLRKFLSLGQGVILKKIIH